MNTLKTKQGFISLFTVLLATVILAIGVGMSSIALKQVVLSSTADDSNDAFYAADAGLQCAIMHDLEGVFQTGSPTTVACGSLSNISVISYDSGRFILVQEGLDGFEGFEWSSSDNNCVRVIVSKNSGMTEIESFGYNVTCGEINQSPRTVERALRVRYGSN